MELTIRDMPSRSKEEECLHRIKMRVFLKPLSECWVVSCLQMQSRMILTIRHNPPEKNVAGLSWNGQGLETSLFKGCPNRHSSFLLWMHALNGGILDYSDVHVSSLSDETPIDKRFAVGSLSAAAALAFHGIGLFLGMAEHNDTASCSIVDATVPPLVQSSSQETKNLPEGTQRFDMGGAVGSFDVSVFADGNGFFIHHVNSGQTVMTTVIASDAQGVEIASPFVMVYSSTPRHRSTPMTVQTEQLDRSICPSL
jgi:hypothetical protein